MTDNTADLHRYAIDNPCHQAGGRYLCKALDTIADAPRMLKLAVAGSGQSELLQQEGALLSQLRHPNLVAWHDQFLRFPGPGNTRVDGFAMELVEGVPFGQDRGSLVERLGRFLQLLSATHYLHRCGYLHLDIKPDNVLVTGDRAVLVDLGSACPLNSGPRRGGGTPGYAAPEILQGQTPSIASDMYSLGALLYETLAGCPPFAHVDTRLRDAILAGQLRPLRSHNPMISTELAGIVDAMLASDPQDRPESLDEIAAALVGIGANPQLWAPSSGVPPFIGRQLELYDLTALISEGGEVLVSGRTGSGRRRLAQEALRQAALRGILCVDLSEDNDRTTSIERIAAAEWFTSTESAVLFVGHGDERQRTRISAQFPNVCVLWTLDNTDSPRAIHVGALSKSDVNQLCAFMGTHAPDAVTEARKGSGDFPGLILRKLTSSAHRYQEGQLPGLLRVLSALPAGAPAALVESLPSHLHDSLHLLESKERILREDDRLYVDPSASASLTPDEQAAVLRWTRNNAGRDPLWAALASVKLGSWDLACGLLAPVIESIADVRGLPSRRSEEFQLLCEQLVQHGYRPAWAQLAQTLRSQGHRREALALLEPLDDRTEEEQVQYVITLRILRRYEDAVAICEREHAHSSHPRFITEYIENIRLLQQFDRTQELIDQFSAELAAIGPFEQLKHKIRLMVDRRDAGMSFLLDEEMLDVTWTNRNHPQFPRTALTSAARLYDSSSAHPEAKHRSVELYKKTIELVDRGNDRRNAAGLRLNLSNILYDQRGKIQEAIAMVERAYQISREMDAPRLRIITLYNMFRFYSSSGRWPEANRCAERLRISVETAHQQSTRLPPDVNDRVAYVRAISALNRKKPAEALALLDSISIEKHKKTFRIAVESEYVEAHLQLGTPEKALSRPCDLDWHTAPFERAAHMARLGRAHFMLARRHMQSARALVPSDATHIHRDAHREQAGYTLLAAAGEDLAPKLLPQREADLALAARLLQGEDAARALELKHALSSGGGVSGLEGITELTESIHEPAHFPAALARLVTRTIRAHRVLIMLKIPGMGHQVSFTELTGVEAAGIGDEVLRRLRTPEDYWLAEDAFSDQVLRETSQTVRTFQLKSLVAVPIVSNGKAIGALYVDDQHQIGRFTMSDVHILRRLARAVGGLVPLIKNEHVNRSDEPDNIYGLLTSDPRAAAAARQALSMIQGEPQVNLLITGETGTGKSVLARRVATELLGCTGLEEVVLRKGDTNLLVTQLMGSRRGDFTGAVDQEGAIQRALQNGRALFLDEIQNLGEEGQQALLPLLEVTDRRFGRLTGGSTALRHPLHIILATNADTTQSQWAQHFREDLWYRMSAAHLHLPPLRERGAESVYRYLARILGDLGSVSPEKLLRPAALAQVTSNAWPGNLRQLRTFATQAAHRYRSTNQPLFQQDLPSVGIKLDSHTTLRGQPAVLTNTQTLQAERMLNALRRNGWVQRDAAMALDMRPANFSKLLKKYGLRDEVKRQRREHRDRDR